MSREIVVALAMLFCPLAAGEDNAWELDNADSIEMLSASDREVLGKPGVVATYCPDSDSAIPGSVVRTFSLGLGPLEEKNGRWLQWLHLQAAKPNGERFSVWILTDRYPPASIAATQKAVARYILQEGSTEPLEFRHQFSGEVVLPSLGAWNHLFPRAVDGVSSDGVFAERVRYLGKVYRLESLDESKHIPRPTHAKVLRLLPDVLIGVPHNTRQKDETRRYDDSDYELIRLTKRDYSEMIEAGMNCLRVDKEQASWINRRDVLYWGIGGNDVSYPECLYRSNYLGPVLFMDEPAVCTRDHVVRPRLRQDQEFRRTITPHAVLDEFQQYFHKAKYQGSATTLLRNLAARPDVDVGEMGFLQRNLYTWETMASSALYQLGEGPDGPPSAMVFEPPGRLGTLRTLPEMNMAYGCQIPVDNPKNLIGIIYGFLRGAARLTNKEWGTSIYGQVDRADTFWFLTHAYDLGAQRFFFWDSHRLACVPYSECLALARNLRAHAESHPYRELEGLKHAAEVAILLPPGYNLGHVYMGRGNLWGLAELNLERANPYGVKYRTVMENFFTEIERCIRMGVAYDLLWDLDECQPAGYREVVRVREDGRVEVAAGGKSVMHEGPRTPDRPTGNPPQLTVEVSTETGQVPLEVTARAILTEGSSPVYYTLGADSKGVYRNAKVFWELYGPGEEDYRCLSHENLVPHTCDEGTQTSVEMGFRIGRPGRYRLRAATVDQAGRTAIVWTNITVED